MRTIDLAMLVILGSATLGAAACGSHADASGDDPPVATSQPSPVADGGVAPDAAAGVLAAAAAKYPDYATLWAVSISRTCGPNNGVCHQSKQFPAMDLPTSLFGSLNANCNQLRQDRATIDNLCEAPGDLVQIGAFTSHAGSIAALPAASPTTLELTMEDAAPPGTLPTRVSIVRKRTAAGDVTFAIPDGVVTSVRGKKIVFDYAKIMSQYAAPGPNGVASMGRFLFPTAFSVQGNAKQVELGDPNADGVFGATLGGALIRPGDPTRSYLMLRVVAPLAVGQAETNVAAAPGVESQMPLANFSHWDGQPSVTALWCWISGLAPDGANANQPIDYAHCDIGKMPAPVAQEDQAKNWSEIFGTILRPSCAGCHHAGNTVGTTLYMDDATSTYGILLGISGSGPSEAPSMPYITPGDPAKSFLFTKLHPSPPAGVQMPQGGALPQASIDAIETWIKQGALDN